MYAILIYGFPLTLLAFEWGLRTLLHVDSAGFTGPTLAATALSFIIPLVKPKEIKLNIPNMPNVVAISKFDSIFIAFVWIAIFIFLFAWCCSCYCSITEPNKEIVSLPVHLLIGGALYLISLILIFIKEKV